MRSNIEINCYRLYVDHSHFADFKVDSPFCCLYIIQFIVKVTQPTLKLGDSERLYKSYELLMWQTTGAEAIKFYKYKTGNLLEVKLIR